MTEEILSLIRQQREQRCIGVLLSGDTGFYSGAKKLARRLEEAPDLYDVEVIPGISSVSYLAARLCTSWEDAAIVSLHGREAGFILGRFLQQENISPAGRKGRRQQDASETEILWDR